MSCDSSSAGSQASKEGLAFQDTEKKASSMENMYPKNTSRSVSEEAKGEIFLKLLLTVSGTPRDEDYGALSAADREDVDKRLARLRNNVAMKALKVELKRLARRKMTRKHKSYPAGETEVSVPVIHKGEDSSERSRLPPTLSVTLGEAVEEVDGPADRTHKPLRGWRDDGRDQNNDDHLRQGTQETDSLAACTPSTPGTTPPLQTFQTKQSVQRVDSTASSRSTDSGYASDRGANGMANLGGGRRSALESLAEDEPNTPTPASNRAELILESGQCQGDLQIERDSSSATPKPPAESDNVFSSSFKRAMSHNVRFEEHSSIEYDERGEVVGVSRERSMEETLVMSSVSGMDVQLSKEELGMASNDEEVRYLCHLKSRYQAEFSNVMEFQELMKKLDRPPTINDYLAFKLKSISDRYDSAYDAPISNAVSMIVNGSMDKILSDSFFSSAVEPLLRQARKAADLPFLMNLLGRRLLEVLPQEMMADGVADLVGRAMAHDFDEELDTDDIIAVLTDEDEDMHCNPQEMSELIQRHFSSADDLTRLPGVPGVGRPAKTTRTVHPSASDDVDGPVVETPQDTDSDGDSGTDNPPDDPSLMSGPAQIAGLLDELADNNTKSLRHSLMKSVPFVLMVALQNLT